MPRLLRQQLRGARIGASRAVLLHGFTGSAEAWPPAILSSVAASGLDPIPLDLPGHGRNRGASSPDAFTLDAAVASVADASDGGPLIGYSMGGRIALHVASRQPELVSRLVLESASPGLRSERERAARIAHDAELAERILADGIEAFVDMWERLPIFASRKRLAAPVKAAVRARTLRNDPRSLAAALQGFGTGTLPSLWQHLPRIEVPTLLIAGELDVKFVAIAEQMSALLPNGRLVVVPEAGHTVHLERPDAWCATVDEFLGGPGSTRSHPRHLSPP